MKFIKWKSLIITCAVCLLPILLGVAFWNELPETIAIHFNIHNEPDGFASKVFAVFGLPALMVILQAISCFIYDINAKKHGERVKFERVTKWIIPIMSLILQPVTLIYSLGWNMDIRRVAVLIVGTIFIVTGNYLPKLDYVKDYSLDTEKARKINRFIGFGNVIMGLLFLFSIFFKPVVSVICLFSLIPYTIITVIYSIRVVKKK